MAIPSNVSFSHTATDDNPFRLTNEDIYFDEVNFHAYTNSMNYGNSEIQEGVMPVGAYASFRHGNLKDFYFKNSGAGANGKIVAILTLAGGK
jgi:hypothetical protein